MRILQEFKAFAMRGNVVDLAVGIIIGVEFGKIVNSLVKDVIMPPIGYLTSGIDFQDLSYKFTRGEDVVEIKYGAFINSIITFTIVAFAVFILVKLMNKMQRKEADAPPPPAPLTRDQELLIEIRDALRAKKV